MPSAFSVVPHLEPPDVINLLKEFHEETSQKKLNLIVGAYRTEDGKPWVLPVVRKVEAMLAADEDADHEYLPFLGCNQFSTLATALLLGKDSKALKENRATGIQTVSCAGALSIGARFLVQHMGAKYFYYSAETWVCHESIFAQAGVERRFTYRYWDGKKRGLDMDGLLEDLSTAEPNSVVILQPCAHNPTGCDPTQSQWVQIATLMKEKNLFPFFDFVYQGFASGVDEDAKVVRYFCDRGFEIMCAQSFSKMMGLYGERVGNLTFVSNEASTIPAVRTQVEALIVGSYMCPPSHGAKVAAKILNDPDLFDEWQECVRTMRARIKRMREGLRERLEKLGTPGTWDHITSQVGMFSFTGMTPAQMEYLKRKHHVYGETCGRLVVAKLTPDNLDYVANSIHDTIINVKK